MTPRHITSEKMQAASEIGGKLTICPHCGHPRFYTTNTYHLVNGVKRRLRQCFQCGYARNEIVPQPIPDDDNC
jgi:C4-type Zn-finger protein